MTRKCARLNKNHPSYGKFVCDSGNMTFYVPYNGYTVHDGKLQFTMVPSASNKDRDSRIMVFLIGYSDGNLYVWNASNGGEGGCLKGLWEDRIFDTSLVEYEKPDKGVFRTLLTPEIALVLCDLIRTNGTFEFHDEVPILPDELMTAIKCLSEMKR